MTLQVLDPRSSCSKGSGLFTLETRLILPSSSDRTGSGDTCIVATLGSFSTSITFESVEAYSSRSSPSLTELHLEWFFIQPSRRLLLTRSVFVLFFLCESLSSLSLTLYSSAQLRSTSTPPTSTLSTASHPNPPSSPPSPSSPTPSFAAATFLINPRRRKQAEESRAG